MTTIDPGEGYELLGPLDVLKPTDEYHRCGRWLLTSAPGFCVGPTPVPYRRKTEMTQPPDSRRSIAQKGEFASRTEKHGDELGATAAIGIVPQD